MKLRGVWAGCESGSHEPCEWPLDSRHGWESKENRRERREEGRGID